MAQGKRPKEKDETPKENERLVLIEGPGAEDRRQGPGGKGDNKQPARG